MNNELLQALVEEDSGYKSEGKWGRSIEHSSLIVDEENQKWYWNSQDLRGDVLAYLILVRGLPKKKAQEILSIRGKIVNGSILDERRHMESTPYDKLIDMFWSLGKYNRKYWYDRKIKDSTIDRYRLGFYKGWYTIPLFENGRFLNFQCRRDEPNKFIRYWYDNDSFSPVLLNPELLGLVDTIYITEGFVDAILLNQEGIPAISQTGGSGYWNGEWFPLFSRVKNIYYLADNDKAGLFGARRVAESLGTDRVRIFIYDGKKEGYDTGDHFKEGGTAKELKQMVEQGSKYIFEIGEFNGQKIKRTGNKGPRKNYW